MLACRPFEKVLMSSSVHDPDQDEDNAEASREPSDSPFDDYAAEEHASKVFALWELAPPEPGADFGEKPEEDLGETSSAPEEPPVAEDALEVESASVQDEALPGLPRARSTRNVLLGGALLAISLLVGGGIAIFSGASPNPVPPPPSPVAPPAPVVEAPAPTPVVELPPERTPIVEPQAAVPTPIPAPTAAPALPEPAVPAPAEPPAPVLRRLRIRTVPSSATLSLDGRTVANPYDGRLPDGSSHTATAQAADFRERTQRIELHEDRELTLRLEPTAPASRDSATPEPRHHEPRRPRARPRGAGFVTESPY